MSNLIPLLLKKKRYFSDSIGRRSKQIFFISWLFHGEPAHLLFFVLSSPLEDGPNIF